MIPRSREPDSTQCGASTIAARCIGYRSTLRGHMQRTASDGPSGCRFLRTRLPGHTCPTRPSSPECFEARRGQQEETAKRPPHLNGTRQERRKTTATEEEEHLPHLNGTRQNRQDMNIIETESASDPRLAAYCTLTEAQLRNRLEPEKGIFIAESPKVIRVAMEAGYEPVSLLCERKHIEGDAADIAEQMGDKPIYTGSREVLSQLTGYTLTRGVLCAMRRPKERSVQEVCQGASRIVLIHGVVDSTNIGAIFRSAAALGIVGRPALRDTQRTGLQDGGHGTHRQKHPPRCTLSGYRRAAGHRDGHRRGWSASERHRGSRLRGAHPHAAWSGFAKRSRSLGSSVLATAKAHRLTGARLI